MKVLLDTHALVWALADPDRLSPRARMVLSDGDSLLFASVASAWELAILQGLGRVHLHVPLERIFTESLAALGVRLLPIQLAHVAALRALPQLHRDPFDRMLIAAAAAEGLSIVSRDGAFEQYGVPVVW